MNVGCAVFWPYVEPPKPHVTEWKAGPAVPPVVRDALRQALSALNTASSDTPADLEKPERLRVLNRRMQLIRDALDSLPKD